MAYTLELFHLADQEAGSDAIVNAPNLSGILNALRAEDLGNDGIADNSITISSGDAIIPGLFYDASAEVFGTAGIGDIQIQNELGIEAITLGNHEFDFGTRTLSELITGQDVTDDSDPGDGFVDTVPQPIGDFDALTGTALDGLDFGGANFAYLSANLDFSTDGFMAPLEVAGGAAPQAGTVTSSIVLEEGGELIGVVGATTPTLGTISSPGGVGISPAPFGANPTDAELDALAAEIQAEVDALLADNPTMNKVILSAHMQRLEIELGLAERLENVDIIIGGGSNTRLTDADDRLIDGDVSQGTYPQFVTNAGGTQTVVVNTDGSYKYLGRLVIEFDADGNIIPSSYDAAVSGAYATDDQGVADLGAAGLIDPEVQAIADAIEAQIVATESNVFGVSDVFLNGNRSGTGAQDDTDGVRTQETNLGNLTADANLAAAREVDPTVVLSIKNGGGIRANIGETIVPAGGDAPVRSPNGEVVDGGGNVVKPQGGISQNDIATTLAFNNNLTLLTLTRAELIDVLEHGLAVLPGVGGQFLQVSGVRLSFDETRDAGERIVNAAIVDDDGAIVETLVSEGEMVGAASDSFRIVTLGFLAGGGDGYPFPQGPEANVLALDDLDGDDTDDAAATGVATFAFDGTEQDALAEYLAANFPDADNAFDAADTGAAQDMRLVQLAKGGVDFSTAAAVEITGTTQFFSGVGTPDEDNDEGRAEIVAVDGDLVFVTNAVDDQIDVFDRATGDFVRGIDLTGLTDYDGLQSVAAKNGVVAVAVNRTDGTENRDGVVALYDTEGTLLAEVTAGNLPDAVAFNAAGTMLAVANEGEPGDGVDAPGSVTLIDISNGAENATATQIDFTGFDGQEDTLREAGVRIFPGKSASEDFEPELAAFSPDGSKVFVSLQENNAIAVIDVASGTVDRVFSAGVQDFSTMAADVFDRDDIFDPQTFDNVVSMRMPDMIASFESGGTTYVLTANEGDARDADARVGDFLDGDVDYDIDGDGTEENVTIDASVDTTGLERLDISAIDGDTDGDGDIDVLHAYGGRSFSIFTEDGTLVFDSGSDFARLTADLNAEGFVHGRSDNKGTEPEAITVGSYGGKTYAFIALERDSGIMVYDVTDPANSVFVEYFAPGDVGISPEGLAFVPAAESVNGTPQLVVSYEVDGVSFAYDLDFGLERSSTGSGADDTLTGTFADDVIIGKGGDDALAGGDGDDTMHGSDGEDSLLGEGGNDLLRGHKDDDSLDGGAGVDLVAGNAGDDDLQGGDGADVIRGGGGDDTLTDGAGADLLVGGDGADTFVFVADGEIDVVRRFEDGVDTLDLSAWGVTAFGDLTIEDRAIGDSVRIIAGDEVLLVNGLGIEASDFDAAAFVFADVIA